MRSGFFESGRYGGGSHGPWVSLYWNETEQNISSASTRVRLRFYFEWDARIDKTFRSNTGTIYGSSFTTAASLRAYGTGGKGSVLLGEKYVWISHNANGTKTENISAKLDNASLSWSGSNIGSMTVSGAITLTPITRVHEVSSASMANNLKPNTVNSLTINGTAHQTSLYYWTGIYDGGTHVWNYTHNTTGAAYNTGNPFGAYTISTAGVNAMLNRMGTATSKTFRARVWTYSGNGTGNLGVNDADFTVTVDSTVKPSISSRSVSEYTSGIKAQFGAYVQGQSRLSISMSASAGYGSSISSYEIVANGSTYRTSSATTGVLKNSGSQKVTFKAWDARGRVNNTTETTINVLAYSRPKIDSFTVQRRSPTSTTVRATYTASISSVGSKNTKKYILWYRRVGASSWSSVALDSGAYSYTGKTRDVQGISLDYDYEFELTVQDYFSTASATGRVDSSFTLINFGANKRGMAFGGVYNPTLGGILQIVGDIYENGKPMETAVEYDWVGGQNGAKYIKFKSGLMLQWGHQLTTLAIDIAWGSLYYKRFGNIVYPVAFSQVPYFMVFDGDGNTMFPGKGSSGASRTQSGSVDLYLPLSSAAKSYDISWLAIGQWN